MAKILSQVYQVGGTQKDSLPLAHSWGPILEVAFCVGKREMASRVGSISGVGDTEKEFETSADVVYSAEIAGEHIHMLVEPKE